MSDSTNRQQRMRKAILEKLGNCCKQCGFSDSRALQIDHINGSGNKELQSGRGGGLAYYYRVLRDTENQYQLLCANCNWIKRSELREAKGQGQHKKSFKMKRVPKQKGYSILTPRLTY